MIAEENCLQIIDEYGKFVEELEDSATTSSLAASEMIYQKKMEEILADENCFKITMVCYITCMYSRYQLSLTGCFIIKRHV